MDSLFDSFQVSVGCLQCGTSANWPDSPQCECGNTTVVGGESVERKPHLRLLPDLEEEPGAE